MCKGKMHELTMIPKQQMKQCKFDIENFSIQSSPQHTFAAESFTRELLGALGFLTCLVNITYNIDREQQKLQYIYCKSIVCTKFVYENNLMGHVCGVKSLARRSVNRFRPMMRAEHRRHSLDLQHVIHKYKFNVKIVK